MAKWYLWNLRDTCASRVNGENQWIVIRREKKEKQGLRKDRGRLIEEIEDVTGDYLIGRHARQRLPRSFVIVLGYFCMQKEEEAACKNDAQDEEREASRMNPATSTCPTPGIETASCWARSRSGRAEKREDHAEKEKKKEKNEELLWRRRSAFLSGLSSARSLKITWTHVKIACRRASETTAVAPDDFQTVISRGIGTHG